MSSNSYLGEPNFNIPHRLLRAIWQIVWGLLASWTPPPLHKWRGFLLRCFGAKVHSTARIYSTARVWYPPNLTMKENSVLGPNTNCYCMNHILIEEKAIVSQGAQLCGGTHDIESPNFQLKAMPIKIGSGAWVAADAFIGPGVSLGENSVVGARAVLFKDAEPFGVYVGNPAVKIKTRSTRKV